MSLDFQPHPNHLVVRGLPAASVARGGSGSGHFGHAGRPGEKGGSASGGGGGAKEAAGLRTATEKWMEEYRQSGYETGQKFRTQSGDRWVFVGVNDQGIPYFTKPGQKTQYTVGELQRQMRRNLGSERPAVRIQDLGPRKATQ